MISLHNVSKKYEDQLVLDKITLHVYEGDKILISGDSGIGKSTLVRCISGLESFSGDIQLNGTIAYVVQNHPFMPWLSIFDNLLLPLKLSSIVCDNIKDKILTLCEDFGVEDHVRKYPDEVSGGQLQRFALIQALLVDSDIIILDEAFKGLHDTLYEGCVDMFMQHALDKTVLFITHDKINKTHFSKELQLYYKKYIYKPLV
jgi:ABC-type nitrate/sulfonate/bicarbonate transport system ATPase subunit